MRQLLEPHGKAVSLHHLAVKEGFVNNRSGVRGLRIGIDIRRVLVNIGRLCTILTCHSSGWIFRACYRHGKTKNPELSAIFARCARLLSIPVFPIFVFDGPGRPRTKRNKTVHGTEHWLTKDTKEMLDYFGFPWIQVRHSRIHVHSALY